MKHEIIHGDCLHIMQSMQDNSIDFVVTDPPYGLHFLSKSWDKETPSIDIWKEMLRICKPGSWAAIFGGSRTHHRTMIALEDAGWEIRDCIMWIYSQGFPKSYNKFGLEGYGTALKPAYEPIILCMKPLDGTFKQNAEKWGLAGINIDDSRIETNDKWQQSCKDIRNNGLMSKKARLERISQSNDKGRWPANIILDEESAALLDQQSGILKSGNLNSSQDFADGGIYKHGRKLRCINDFKENSGGASRFFYCAKASPSERNAGCKGLPRKMKKVSVCEDPGKKNYGNLEDGKQLSSLEENFHPTVKPLSLMKYIIKLLAPPDNPICLDPFAGSGTTVLAAQKLGISCIGIEKEKEYCDIANKRLELVLNL